MRTRTKLGNYLFNFVFLLVNEWLWTRLTVLKCIWGLGRGWHPWLSGHHRRLIRRAALVSREILVAHGRLLVCTLLEGPTALLHLLFCVVRHIIQVDRHLLALGRCHVFYVCIDAVTATVSLNQIKTVWAGGLKWVSALQYDKRLVVGLGGQDGILIIFQKDLS